MTATRAGTRAEARPEGNRLQLATEIALGTVSVAAVVGMHRLFEDGGFFPPLFLQVVVAHVTVTLLRRAGWRLLPASLATAAVAVLAITWLQYGGTTAALLPTPTTFSTIDADIDTAWQLFREVQAPAPVHDGFLVATSLAVWLIVFVADWGAFRTGVSFEALLPPATLFLFAAVLGAEGSRAAGATLFVAACLLFLLLHRTWRQEDTATWAALHSQRGRWSLLTSGTVLASVAVLFGGVLGPNLPGADDPPIIPWKDLGDEDETRVVVSPLVDIRSRLVDQENVEVFTVKTDDPDFPGTYWRLTSLDKFNGRIWSSSYATDDADGELDTAVENDTDVTRVRQTITINALAAIWLPAAFQPVAIETHRPESGRSPPEVDYAADSATLIVDREADTSDGLTYTVTSDVPTWSAEQLRQASEEIPRDIAQQYLDLPELHEEVTSRAEEVTAGAPTAFDKALALQQYLRSFEYSLDVQPGHSADAIYDFLIVNRRGYCEQFAGAFAAMARSIGLPSRVVVGFTKGVQDDFEPTLFRVNGRQAHAWVEVYFHGFGWVTFDPTPGRAPPAAEEWLGEREQQDVPGATESTASTVPGEAQAPGAPVEPGSGQPGPANPNDLALGEADSPITPRESDEESFLIRAVKEGARTGGVSLLTYVVVVPLALVGLRWLRRLRARSALDKVGLSWREIGAEASETGLALPASLTVAERARRLRATFPDLAEEVGFVASWVEQVNYAGNVPTDEDGDQALRAATAMRVAAARRRPWSARVLRYLDARRLLPHPERSRRSAHGAVRTSV